MNEDRLATLIEKPEIQQRILGDYDGGYSLGLTVHPEKNDEIAIRVRVEGQSACDIPSEIVLDGEAIPVIVNTGFRVPQPLKGRS
jgi:hypothetical protein